MSSSKKQQPYDDNSQGIVIPHHTRHGGHRTPTGPLRPIRRMEPSRPLVGHPGERRGIPRAPTIREDRSAADFPTSVLQYPRPIPDCTPVVEAYLDGRWLYSLREELRPGVAGFSEMKAELGGDGGGKVWRVWTISGRHGESVAPPVPFPMTFEEIARLYAAALHARHIKPGPVLPDPDKEGA